MSSKLKKLPPGDMFTIEVAANYLGYGSADQLLLMERHGDAALIDQDIEDGRTIKVMTRAEVERLHGQKSQRAGYNTIERRNHLKMMAVWAASYAPPSVARQPWAQAKELLQKAASRGIPCPFCEDTMGKALREGLSLLDAPDVDHEQAKAA